MAGRRVDVPPAYAELDRAYQQTLERAPLAAGTRRAYAYRVRGYLASLATAQLDGDPLAEHSARDWAVRDYRNHLQTVTKRAPATINTTLAALDHFYAHLHLGAANAARADLPAQAPRALEPHTQKRFLRAVEHLGSTRDRATALLLFYAGPRVGELVAVDTDDINITARKGELIIRHAKGAKYRQIPLHPAARTAISDWNNERPDWPGAHTPPLLLNRYGGRLSDRAVNDTIAAIGEHLGIDDLTPHVLRHTFGTNLVRAGTDVVLVAELLGHRRLDTTRRYSLPTAADRQRVIDQLPNDR